MVLISLPYLCLRRIFDFLDFDDLINCYEAFDEWKPTILDRLAPVKYLLPEEGFYGVPANAFNDNQLKTISCAGHNIVNMINHYNENQNLLPNLKMFFVTKEIIKSGLNLEIFKEFIENKQSLKGLVFFRCKADLITASNNYVKIPNIEYIAIDSDLATLFDPVQYEIANQIKQIYHPKYFCEYECFNHAPNVIRLHASSFKFKPYRQADFSYGVRDPVLLNGREKVMRNLEILELGLDSNTQDYSTNILSKIRGFRFINNCPVLKSVYLEIGHMYENIDKLKKNLHMRDMVFSYEEGPPKTIVNYNYDHDWFYLKLILTKFPNIKHLAIRHNSKLRDDNARDLVNLLPKLVLLDLRGSTGITQRSVDYVADYCKRTNRNIKIYIDSNADEIKLDWPNLSTDYKRICKGVDFMKHCFLKPFEYLPYFMVPDDPDW